MAQNVKGGVSVGAAAAERLTVKPSPTQKPTAPSVDLDPKNMAKVIAYVAERKEADAQTLVDVLKSAGVINSERHTKLETLRSAVTRVTPDLIIIGADIEPGVFSFIRDIRHSKLGSNPFLLITTLVSGDQFEAVKKTMQAGTDDIVVKPVKEDQLLQRLRRVTVNRQAFVVTSDYLGPDRRAKSRPSSIRRIEVLNTVLEKANGNDIQPEEIKSAVEGSMNDVLHARLDSNSYRLGFVCNIIMDAYANNEISPDIKEKILVLVDVLRDAAKTAERIQETELGLLCGSLAKEVEGIAERYQNPTERDLKVIQKLTRAVMMVVKPHVSPEVLEKEAREAARNYMKRQRGQFAKSQEIHRSPDDPPVEAVDEPVIEIMPLTKGQALFAQGDPATSAYIVASGSVGIYRDIDGKRVPVARIKKGELFGEMAIIDATPRRATAIALENCTLSLISKQMIEEKMAAADAAVNKMLHLYISNIRKVPEIFAPRPRSAEDIAAEMKTQTENITRMVRTSKSSDIASEANTPLVRLEGLIKDIGDILVKVGGVDRRNSVHPSAEEIPADRPP